MLKWGVKQQLLTYSSICFRIFSEGRTETIRPVSEYSVQFVKSMLSESATREQKIMLLRKAVQYQTQIKMDACCGLGWDRHLIGLFYCCQEMKMTPPALFRDKVYSVKLEEICTITKVTSL